MQSLFIFSLTSLVKATGSLSLNWTNEDLSRIISAAPLTSTLTKGFNGSG